MDPFFARNRLSAYLDGALDPDEHAQVEAALAADAALHAEYEAMAQAVAFLKQHGPARAPADLHAQIMARLPSAPPRLGVLVRLRSTLRQIPVEAAALAAAALLVVVILGAPKDDPIASAPATTRVKSGSAVPGLQIEASNELSLPRPLPPAPVAAKVAPDPSPALGGGSVQRVTTSRPPDEVFFAEWEKAPAGAVGGTLSGPEDDLNQTPSALYQGVPPVSSITHAYRIGMADAEVLYSLQRIALSTGGVLLDSQQRALTPYTLSPERNFARIYLRVPFDAAASLSSQLAALGARALRTQSDGPLQGASEVLFEIEATYLP